MRYLIDSDVLVGSSRIHYRTDFCQLFWDWLEAGYKHDLFYSLDKVEKELDVGDKADPLRIWSKSSTLSGFFLPSASASAKWASLANWANNRQPKFLNAGLAKFLDIKSADAWLIAYAATEGNFTIVTNEVPAPQSLKDIKLPDAAASQGVSTISLPELLLKHAHSNFKFRP